MLFNSFGFIIFFSVISILYYILPNRFRWFWLLLASIYFYMYSQTMLIIVPVSIIIITFLTGLFLEKETSPVKKKYIYLGGILVNLGMLIFFKYVNFFYSSIYDILHIGKHTVIKPLLNNLWVPLGLSYITFQGIGYLIEIYRGNHGAEKHPGYFATYLLFFPKIIAGPVERAHHFLPQFRTKKDFDYDTVVAGLKLMLWGFFKKLVIADRLQIYVDTILKNYAHHNSITLIVAYVFSAIQLYADFSGYTDIALGIAKVLGFDMTPNFNRPFFAKSVTEFWRKWHISLSKWFTDYVYTSIIINLRSWGKWSPIFGLNATFILLGMWHGPNWTFVTFGLLQGIALTIEFFTRKSRKQIRNKVPTLLNDVLGIIYAFGFFSFSMIFFKADTVTQALDICSRIFLWKSGGLFIGSVSTMFYAVIGIIILFVTEVIEEYQPQIFSTSLVNSKYKLVRHSSYVAIILLILLLGVFNESQFIYFKF